MASNLILSTGNPVLQAIQQDYPGYHPLLAIAQLVHSDYANPALCYGEKQSPLECLKFQLECHKTLAKFVQPELKSIEIRTQESMPHVKVSLFDLDESDIVDADIIMESPKQEIPFLADNRSDSDAE